VTQKPTFFCIKCETDRPPLFASGMYTCVMCGKTRNIAEYRQEMAKIRAAEPEPVYVSRSPRLEREEITARAKVVAEAARNAPPRRAPPPRRADPAPKPKAKATPRPAAKAAPKPAAKASPKPAPKPAAAKAPAKKPAAAKAPAPAPAAQAEPPQADVVVIESGGCAWKECSNQARPKSKYCSRACSNKNARWRHSQRKK